MEKVTLKGTFDASEILAGLKKIQQTMESSGMSSNLFTRMTEQMAAAESEINRVERKLREGFSSQKEFNAVENSIRSIYDQLNKITRGLSNVNTNQNIFDGLTRNMQKELAGLEKAIDSKKAELNKKIANFFESSLGVKNKVEAQNTAELIKNEQDLTKEVQRRYEIRQKEIALAEKGLRSRIGQKKDELINAANLTTESFGGKRGSKGNLNATISAINKLVEDPNVTVAQLRSRFTEQFYKENSQKGYSGDFVGLGAAREKYQVIKGGVVEAAAGTAEAKAAFDSLINSIVANAVNSVRTQTKKIAQERNSLQNVGTLDSSGKLVPGTALTAQVQVLNERQKEITALQEQYKAKQLAMNAPANTVSSTVEQNARAIEKQNAALKNSNKVMDENLKSTRAAIVENKNLYNTFDMLQYTIQRWFSAITIVSKLTQTIKKTFNEVRELDKSFASIAMVTDYSVQQMWESYDKYAQLANKLGQSTKDVIASSALFFQQGLKTNEVFELTEQTMKLATLAGTSFAESTSQMTAALRGFNMEMNEGARVTDVYSELAANAAADVKGIAYAMSKTSNIAASAGMSFEVTAALLAKTIESTQEAAENIGTAMKSIIGRFGELKKDVAGTPLSEFEDLDFNKVDAALKSVGINLKTADGQFRDLDEVLLELSSRWDGLSRNSQRYIATQAAGSRQQSRFIAAMSDYKRTVELVEIAQNSAGRSSEQFAKYQDTLEMKIKRLQNTWEQFRVKIGRSDIFKNVVDGANEALNKSTQLDWTQILGIGIIGVTIGKRIVTDLISQIRETSSQFTNLGVQMGNSFQSGINKAMGAVSANVKRTAKDLQVVTAAKNTQKRIDNNAEKYYQLAYNKQIQKSTAAFGQNFNYSGKEVLVNEEIERSLREIIKLKERINALNLKGEQITEKETLELKQLNGELNKQKQLINNNISQLNSKAAGTKLSRNERNAASAYLINQATTAADTASLAAQRARSRYLYRANRIATPAVEELEEMNNRAIQSERFKSRIASSVSTGLQSALALGLAEAFSGGDIKGIVRSSAEIFGITAIPQFVSAIGPVILKGLTKATGLSTGIIGIIISLLTGIGGLAIANLKKQQKEQQALIDKTKNLRDNIKDTLKELEITYSTSKKTIKQFDTAQEKYKDYIKLTSKTFLSDKDKEQLDTIKDYFAELYPDLEDDIRNGTADIAKILEDIRDQSNQAESIKEAKSVYNIAEVEKEKGDIEKNLKFFEKMALNNSFKSFKADNMVSMMSMSPTLDYTSFFKDNEKALKLYRSGENKAAWKELFKGQDYVEVNKTIKQLYEYILKSFDDVKENVDDDLYSTLAKSSGGTTEANEFIAQALKKTNVLDIADVKITDSQLNSFRQGIVPKIYQSAISNLGIDILELVQDGKFLSLSDIKDEKLSTWINSVFGEKGWEELIGKDKNDFKAVFSTLIKLGNGLDGAAKNILNNVEKYEELVNIIKNDSGLSAKEIEKKANELINKYNLGVDLNSGDNLYTKFKANVDYLDSLGLTAAQSIGPKLAQLIMNSLDSLNLADNTTAAGIINQAAKQADITTIANIPLDNLATLTATEAQTYIQLLEDGGKSAEDAQRIFWEYINKMRLATSRNLTNVEQIDVLREDNETFFESYISNLELIQKAQSDIQKSGFVSTSTRKAMVKANINKKYLDGIGLNEQAVKDFTITAMQPYQNALQQLESSKMAVDSLSKFDRDKFNYGLKYYQLDENFFDSYIGKTYMGYTPTQMEEIKAAAQSGAKSYDEYAAKLNNVVKELNNFPAEQAINGLTVIKEATEANKDAIDKLEKEILKLKKTIHNNDKSIHRLGRQIRDAEKDWLAATEGSENFRSSLDGLVNYTNQMSDLERSIERVGKALENATEQSGSDSLITGLRDSLVNKAGLIQAERRVIESAMDNIAANLTTSFGNVFSVNENGLMNIDIGAFEKLRMSDTFKKEGGEALFNQYNQYYEQREQLIDNAEEVLKAFKDYQKQYLDAVVQAENDVASILEKQNEEEIDNLKDKYAAMEKADNEYLDALEKAINKQRKLRELENDYDDLATKRKKLSLMQRDTSGASQKDILSLSKDIKKSEESVLDKEVDNLIDELKELAETEKDTRDAELEYQEALKETVNWMLLAKDAMSKWTSVEDARAWRLSDPKFDELTEEQQEQELLKVEELYKSYINYLSSSKVEWKNNMEAIANKETEYYKNTFENVSNVGSAILQDAQEKADKERQDTAEKLEDLRQNLEDMEEQQAENLKELAEKETELANLRKSSEQQYLESINIMQEAAKSGFVDVAAFGLQQMASLQSIQFNDLFNEDGSTNTNSAGYKWLSDNGQINNGQISLPGLLAAGQGQTTGKVWGIIGEDGKLIKLNQSAVYNGSEQGYYTDEKKAAADLNKLMTSSKGTFKGFLKQFAEGGLVNFTGPAWVDGTSSRPEAFLSADDTFRIGKAAELLANLPIFNRANDSISTNIGDTSIEIHLNIDKLASDYDVERMLDKVKENIVRIAKPIGSSVILSK